MDRPKLTTMANKFQSVFDAPALDAQGYDLDFCQRRRLITPFRFGLSVVASMAAGEVHTIADLQRQFNALWNLGVSCKGFYDQLAKPGCGTFLHSRLCDMMDKLTLKVLGFQHGHALSEFGRILIQDGSSFALHDALRDVFPGRFNTVNPAAVEIHCTLDLLQDTPLCMVPTPDTASEQDYLPEPENLKGDLLLADRGYLNLIYLKEVCRHGGFFVVRAKEGMNPRIVSAYREDGKRLRTFENRDFQAMKLQFPKKHRFHLIVEWVIEGRIFRLRMIISWNKITKCFFYLLTNLPEDRYDIDQICLIYKLRWQVEIYQSCNLRRTLFWPNIDFFGLFTAQRAVRT